MKRRDHAVVGVLFAVLIMVVLAVGLPAATPPVATSPPTDPPPTVRPYREGIVGQARLVNPLAARTQGDRDLVALLFAGLVRLGPGESFVPDLASSWEVDETGRSWTFTIRDDAHWHDGMPVTAEDVLFTVRTLQDPSYMGPGTGSWRAVSVSALGKRTVQFELASPLGGFLHAATQPLAPAHLLRGVPVAELASDTFNSRPIGSGPFALVALDERHARLEPAGLVEPLTPSDPAPGSMGSPLPTDTIGSPGPTRTPTRLLPYLPAIELHFFADSASLAEAYRDGKLDAAFGLGPEDTAALAGIPGSRLLRYPGSTLTAVALNLRKQYPAFRDAAVRLALLQSIDRAAMIHEAFGGAAERADNPIPPTSWAFDRGSSQPIAHDAAAAIDALESAKWTRLDGHWAFPDATDPHAFELLSPDEASSPSVYRAAAAVAADWRRLGLAVTHVGLPPAELILERLRKGEFAAAVVDLNIGMDPDLYALFASTQATSTGSNLAGVQDPELDKLLLAARAPGTDEERLATYAALQVYLGGRQYMLPLAFRDVSVVVRDRVEGRVTHRLADPGDRFWDVLTWRLAADR
jgi:peptide/nickel transport system substrate-binding protein